MSADPNFLPPATDPTPAAAPVNAPPGPGATPEEKDLWWFRNVYQGDKQQQLTWRAVLTGGLLGAMLSLSNLYTTLKIGWAFGVAITACVLSWAFWRAVRAFSGGSMKEMSILETNCMQSTASSAGYSTGSVVGSACAAILMVNNGQNMPWPIMTAFVFLTACLGVLLAVPMKRQMINHEQLAFPSGIAAAETLRSLYAAGEEAKKKANTLLWAMGFAGMLGILRNLGNIASEGRAWFEFQKAKGLDAWEWISDKTAEIYVAFSNAIQHIHIWHPATVSGVKFAELKFDPSLLTIGAGMIVGMRASISMLIGSAILHFGLGPLLVEHSPAALPPESLAALNIEGDKNWFQHVPQGYNALKVLPGGETALFRWGVWGGTALMVVASLMSLAFQWKSVVRSFRRDRNAGGEQAALAAVEVPGKWMIAGLVPVTIGLVAVLDIGLHIPWYLGLVAVLMAFPLALVACRATGETDTTPIGAMGKVTQLAFAFLHPGQKITNLGSAGTTSAAAASAADLLTDLKSGYLLGANPRRQFLAQMAGVFFGTAIIIPAWYLLSRDYTKLTDKFPMQAASAWKAMADLLNPTDGKSVLESLPWGAPQAIIAGAILGIILPLLEKFLPKYRNWIPSAIGLGLGFVIDFAAGLGFTTGAVIAWIWKKCSPKSADNYTVPLGSGFVAGQAMMEAFLMILVAASQMRH